MKTKLIAAFAALLAVAPSAWAAPSGVTLEAKMVPVIALPAGQRDVTIPVMLILANETDKAMTLSGSNRCETHIWSVTNFIGADVESNNFCTMEYAPQSNPLAAGERQTATETILLHVADYREGETYTLHYRFWGISTEVKFTVKQAQ